MATLVNRLMSPMNVSRIGRYEIKSLIGAGGMATCYLARDSNPKISRLVAIKVLNASIDSPDLRERFARESRALAALSHSNIVDIYDSGEFQGAPYIVMEYIRGETVAEKIKRRAPLTIGEKLKMMGELCDGLAHAHEAGIIHRDIKPANLMVDQRRCLKILDFGIARVAEGSMTRASVQVTQFNMRIGTPGYMSPEQIEGDEIDRRSDIFAVGAVFYELLSYREAFSGNSTRQIENKVLQAAPAPLVSLIPDLDPEIAAIVTRALDKDPNKRFQDAESFAQALEHQRWRLGPAAHTPPPSRATPPPTPTPGARDSRAEVVYQRSMAVYQDGAVDAARRFAIEALAEDPNHLGARALLEKIDPSSWGATSAYLESTSVGVDPTAISSEGYEEATVLRTRAQPVKGTGEPFWRKLYAQRDQWRNQRFFWPAAAAAGLVVVGLLGVVIYQLLTGPAGHELTITKPTGGSILSRGVSCGTIGSDCVVTRPDGEAVELQAQADEGFLFAGYTGDCASGGRTIMSEDRTCGAQFDPIPPSPPAALLALTIQPPKGGTIHAMGGIHCGTQDSQCTASFPQGSEVKLDVLADAGYAFARFTGSCAPDGATVMTEPRTCGALFTRSVAEVKPPAPPVNVPRAPTPVPEPNRPPEPPTPTGAGSGSGAPEPVAGGGTGKDPNARGPLSGASPDMIAKDALRKTLNAFRDGHARMEAAEVRRVYPGASPSIGKQFQQYKSLDFEFTSEPEYPELNLRSGHATVVIGVKRVYETKVGSKLKPDESRATFKLHRLGPDSDEWTIDDVRYHK
jgi:Protein kinase domain/Divergent InlB B-repeat domain